METNDWLAAAQSGDLVSARVLSARGLPVPPEAMACAIERDDSAMVLLMLYVKPGASDEP